MRKNFIFFFISVPYLPREEEASNRAQARICRNLKYNLHQLKLQSDKATT
jgi:hypothetical protein